MSDAPPEKSKGLPVFALAIFPGLVKTARELGYTLAVHGSLARDFDFIACPWIEDAKPAEVLVQAICEAVGGSICNGASFDGQTWVKAPCPSLKPHGRRAWSIHLGCGPYIDLSVMPRNNP